MGIAMVEVDTDSENGPIVRVRVDDRVITVYLKGETACLDTKEGSAGIFVNGDICRFRSAITELQFIHREKVNEPRFTRHAEVY